MIVPLVVLGAALAMIFLEIASPGRSWPKVAGWWFRAALLNGFQALMVLAAGLLWNGWMLRHRPWSADGLGVTGGAIAGIMVCGAALLYGRSFLSGRFLTSDPE